MPSKTVKQAGLMAKAAKDPKFAKRKGISQEVAQEWHEADKRTGMAQKALRRARNRGSFNRT